MPAIVEHEEAGDPVPAVMFSQPRLQPSRETPCPTGQTIMVRDVHLHCRQEAVSEITRFQHRFAQEGAWTDRPTLRGNGWTQFAGDAGALFLQNLQAPA